jgi:hypothetical protein
MGALHIAVTLINAAFYLLALFGIWTKSYALVTFAIIGGFFAGVAAIGVAIALTALLTLRWRAGGSQALLRSQWLGLANGIAAGAVYTACVAMLFVLSAGGV